MSNSVTKLPNGDNHSGQDANRTAGNSTSGTASVKISAGQGREIFNQVNVNLRLSLRDHSREKEKPGAKKNESEVERKDRQAIHQGKDSTETSKKTSGKKEKINDSANPKLQETGRKDSSGKSNNAHQAAKPNHENDSSDAKNNNSSTKNNSRTASLSNETAPSSSESRSAKPSGQPPAETSRNENQISKSPGDNQSAKPNNGANRPNIEFNPQNKQQNNLTPPQANRGQGTANASPSELSAGKNEFEVLNNDSQNAKLSVRPPVKTLGNENQTLKSFNDNQSAKSSNETNRPNIEFNRQNKHQDNGTLLQTKKGQDTTNASPQLSHGRGHDQSRANNPLPANASEDAAQDAPLFNNRNQTNKNRNQINDNRNQTNSNRNNINQTINNALHRNAQNLSMPQTRRLNLTINNYSEIENYSAVDNHFADAPKNNSNSIDVRLNKFLGEVVKQIFRENDVYLSSKAINNLIEHHDANNSFRPNNSTFVSLPKEIVRLVETIENQILQTSSSPHISHKHASNQVVIEIPQSLDNQIQTAKNLLTKMFGVSDAKHFSQMSIEERMLAAVEIFIKNLPAEMPKNLQSNSVEKVLAGFLLARGLGNSDSRNSTENLLGMMQSAAADKVSLTAMRNFGGLVKILISDAAFAKSTANLETAVQKFARILVAINCLDAVLTAVKLASQNQFAGGNVGKNLAVVQVYELIDRLVSAGKRAMNEAAAEVAQKNAAAKGEPDKNTRSVFPSGTIADLTVTEAANKKTGEPKNVAAESALREFLEFNPLFAGDKSVSAFENFDTARQAQNDFLNHHQIEIEQWLRSGNHRLVKDIDFEKPIGIVVERDVNDFLSATTARIVLVRDGSAQGWHFLKSFLVA